MNFIQIRAFDNYISAHIVMNMLLDDGINCHLKDEYTLTIDPLLSPALGGIKLMVADSQVERALELLAGTESNND
jgi:Putative prokaryotic signal transducing protein